MPGAGDGSRTGHDIRIRATALLQAGRTTEAHALLRSACDLQHTDPETWLLFAAASAGLGRFEDVIEGCEHCVALDPGNERAWYNMGLAYFRLDRPENAIAAYRKALAINPGSADTLGNLGAAWLETGNPEQAIEYCTRAVELNPQAVTAINTLGIALRELRRYQDALDTFERGLQLAPDHADLRWNHALALLKLGKYTPGWDEFEWRWRYEQGMQRATPYPAWLGLRPARPLLVYMEQGVGDQVMFASCLPDLRATGSEVIVECDPRLTPLFERSFPGMRFHGGAWDERRPECREPVQRQVAMGSLPRLFRRARDRFPTQAGYLQADSGQVAHWRAALARAGGGLKVGISWRGGNNDRTRNRRTMALTELCEIAGAGDITLIDIQYDSRPGELQAAREAGAAIHAFTEVDARTDLDTFAALLAALDLVISVDNSTLHLAGALGVETWGLLPYDSDWRWIAGLDHTPWYPRTRLWHQDVRGDWSGVIKAVRNALADRATPR